MPGESAGEVWTQEARIVPADEQVPSTTVSTTANTKAFLARVGADEKSVLKTAKDEATVAYWQKQISMGRSFSVALHLDAHGNVIYADGRHRAIAALRSGNERINVVVTRRKY